MAGMPVAWHLKYMPHHISAPSQAKVFFTMFTSEIFYMHVRLQTLQGSDDHRNILLRHQSISASEKEDEARALLAIIQNARQKVYYFRLTVGLVWFGSFNLS